MAIGGYTDIYTVDEYTKRVNEITSEINNLVAGGLISDIRLQVEQEINILRKREQQIYKLLKLKNKSIEGLNQRIQEYKSAVLSLSGEKLNEEIIYMLKEKSDKDFAIFKREVNNLIEREILPKVGTKMDNGKVAKFSDVVLSFLNSQLTGRGFSSTKGMNDVAKEMLLSSITPEQRKGWREILEKNTKAVNEIEIIEHETEDSKIEIFNWIEVTKNLTPKEAEKIDQKDPAAISKINKQIVDKICSLSSDGAFLKQLINESILSENRYAFFVGNNINDIIGICGEIQGMYYLSKLLGSENLSDVKLQWKGGVINNKTGQKPHQDILLKSFGIQIKNSLDEDFHTINFGEASLSTVIQKTGLTDVEDLLANFYGTLNFNVPYKRVNKKYVHGEPSVRSKTYQQFSTFKASYEELRANRKQVDILLSLCASALMYMDVAKRAGSIDANSLYLIGGETFVAASEILSQILSEVDEGIRSFKVDTSFRDKANSRTIVEALNDKNRDSNYSDLVIGGMVLKSSFNFGSVRK